MTDRQRELAETVFERNQRREAEINDAVKQEHDSPRESHQKHVSPESITFGSRCKIG
jgi:hypothetical protein